MKKYSKKDEFDDDSVQNETSKSLNEKYENWIQNQIPVLILDTKKRIIKANSHFLSIIGFSLNEIQNQNFHFLCPKFQSNPDGLDVWTSLERNQHWEGDFNCLSRAQKKLNFKAFVVNQLNNHLNEIETVISLVDQTLLQDIEHCLMQTSKLSALGEIAAGIAHEINNPLAIIVGKIIQIKNYVTINDLNKEKLLFDIEKILNSCDRIVKIVRGFKSISRSTEQDPKELIEISVLLKDAVDLCQEKIKKNEITLLLDLEAGLKLYCFSTQLSQVFLNLILNAVDAISNKNEKWIRVQSKKISASKFQISFIDSGAGIKKDIADRMMTSFFTTKEIGKGTGLGLSISKRIIEDHQGEFFYDPTSVFTKFVIILPNAD